MNRSTLALVTVLGTAMITSGCLLDGAFWNDHDDTTYRAFPRYDGTGGDEYTATRIAGLSAASLGGDFGAVEMPDQTTASVEGLDFGFDRITLMATGEEGTSMAIVDIYGGLGRGGLEPGTTRTWGGAELGGDTVVSVTGCAGPRAYDWDADALAEEVTVMIDAHPEDPDRRIFRFEALFPVYTGFPEGDRHPQTLSGSFEVAAPL